MSTIVANRPSEFVDFLTNPGLPVYDMHIPLAQYVSSNPNYGGSVEAQLVIGIANRKILVDEVAKTKISAFTRNIGRLTSGQGYPDDFILLMKHIADNLDALGSQPELKKKPYFRLPGQSAEVTLNAMVQAKVFGLDCIGFVSQYLVYTGLWQAYKTYYPADYRREFKPVKSLDEVRRLCLVIWGNTHIGIIDNVVEYNKARGELLCDICQSSSGEAKGPQTNRDVVLRMSPGDAYQGAQKFKIHRVGSPAMPVKSPVYICKMDGLVWSGDLAFD